MVETCRLKEIMGIESSSIEELTEAVTHGLPKAALRATLKTIFLEPGEQTKFLYRVVPEATFKRRQGRLSPAESERTERLARVIATADFYLEDRAATREFLTSPHWKFAGKTPIETSLSELGARQVEELLSSIAFGLPA